MARLDQIGSYKTTVHTDKKSGDTVVILYSTEVVRFDNQSVILNSGGWRTNTTKTRMNQTSNQFNLGFTVFQKNYGWFVQFRGGEVVDFTDGMVFDRA